MISPDDHELLRQLSRTPYGRALRHYLDEKYAEIGNISTTKSWDETLGRQFALKFLQELFALMEDEKKPGSGGRHSYT